jgi:hypothetical protein
MVCPCSATQAPALGWHTLPCGGEVVKGLNKKVIASPGPSPASVFAGLGLADLVLLGKES